MKINLPNQITIGRLILSVIFLALLSQFSASAASPRYWLLDVCLVLFVVAAVSDVVDGYLARKYNQVTSFGRIVDPCADKVLILGAFLYFAGPGFVRDGHSVSGVTMWMVVVMLTRELLVTGLRGFAEAKGDAFAAQAWGKAKMAMQSVTAGYILCTLAHGEGALPWPILGVIRVVLVWATVLVTIVSVVSYVRSSRHALLETSRPAETA